MSRRRTAIVADDSVAARKLIGALLRRDGFDVHEAVDGYEAWALIEEHPPDVLVVDDVLPCISAVELVDLLRERPDLGSVRIAFVTEFQSGLDKARLAGLDEQHVIWEPFDLDEVDAQLRAICT